MTTMIDSTISTDDLATALADLDDEITAASAVVETEGDTEADYMARLDLDAILSGACLLKGDQTARTFVKGKEIFRNPDVILAERAARERKADMMRKRIARQRAKRAAADVERDAKPLDPNRMRVALQMLGPLDRVIADLTMQRYNRFRRTLGDVHVHDIAQDAIIAIAEALSKCDVPMVELVEAAMWLSRAPQPFNTADGPAQAGRLLGTIVRIVGTSIVKTYREATAVKTWTLQVGAEGKDVWVQRDTTVDSLDKLATISHNVYGDVDTLIAKHVASGKPKPKSTPPGMREKRLFARAVIDAAIEERGLGWLATMLLDDTRLRTDGSFKWTENADTVWAGFGFPPMATDSPRLKADYARRAVRLAFDFLPQVVMAAYAYINSPELTLDLDAFSGTDVRYAVSKIRADLSNQEHQHAIDGGASLDMTMRMIEDPGYLKSSLACIVGADNDA